MDLLPPSSHFIYIPVVLLIGAVLGFIWGARATREAYRLETRREEERAARRAAREARQAGAAGAAPSTSGGSPPGESG